MFYLMAYKDCQSFSLEQGFHDRFPIIPSSPALPFCDLSWCPKRVWVIYLLSRVQPRPISQSLNLQWRGSSLGVSTLHSFCCSPAIGGPRLQIPSLQCTEVTKACLVFHFLDVLRTARWLLSCIDANITINCHPGTRKQSTNCFQIQCTSAGHMLSVSLVRLGVAKSTVSCPAPQMRMRTQGRTPDEPEKKGNQICRTESLSSITDDSNPPPFQFLFLSPFQFCFGGSHLLFRFNNSGRKWEKQLKKRDLDGMSV